MAVPVDPEFKDWTHKWLTLAAFSGRQLREVPGRIDEVVHLWQKPIPGNWMRQQDSRLLGPKRYCRGNWAETSLRRGEHVIEYEILAPDPAETVTTCLGQRLVDGVNAVPLAKDAGGGRGGNVEADMLLLVGDGLESEYRLLLVEAKHKSGNAWYAAVENLRQMKLFSESVEIRSLFHTRRRELNLPDPLSATAVVLARRDFYTAGGQKALAVAPAQELLRRMNADFSVDAQLATWDSARRVIKRVP
jgi:hypothetical protein